MSKRFRKVGYLVLAGALLLSSAGCGNKKDDKVVDYGVDTSNPSAAPVSTAGDSSESSGMVGSSSKTLREQFGDNVKWSEPFTAQDISFQTNKSKNIPALDYLNLYEVQDYKVSTDGEQEFADGFFDEGATKLEEIKYVDDTQYMIQMYKYRSLTYQMGYSSLIGEDDEEDGKDFSVITADSDIDYKWVDEDYCAIHMYEGKYNGIDYGLIIGYDFLSSRKYVYFEPTDIRAYYPETTYQTLQIESSTSIYGGTIDADNQCSMSEQEVKDMATAFVQQKFGISDYDSQMSYDYDAYNQYLADISYYMSNSQGNAGSISVLTFSDGDYISTTDAALDANGVRSCDRLAEQYDAVSQYMEEYSVDSSWEGFYRALMHDAYKKDVAVTRDGYAVYLNSPFTISSGGNYWYTSYYPEIASKNVGCVMITSKGIFGVDMLLGCETVGATENVALADFDVIEEGCIKAIEEHLDLNAMKNPTNFSLDSIDLVYECKEDEDGDGIYEVVPAWVFCFDGEAGTFWAVVSAIDGSFVSMTQYSND